MIQSSSASAPCDRHGTSDKLFAKVLINDLKKEIKKIYIDIESSD